MCANVEFGQRPFGFKAHFRIAVSCERSRQQIFMGFYVPGDSISVLHLKFGKVWEN